MDWPDWSEEAFATARKRGCPVLLYVHAAWCRWCRELESRVVSRSGELERNAARREELRAGIESAERQLDEEIRTLDELKEQVRAADETSQ